MINHFYHDEVPPFIQDCIQLQLLTRLQNVGMNCGCEYTSFPRFQNLTPYSRFDHSVGVALIVWHFTHSMEQSLAGLFHDIATPVFAHVVDFMRGDYLKQEATEEGTVALIRGSSELKALLKKYNISAESICDYHKYPIADNDSPRLSADRLEYTLGNAVNYGFSSEETVKEFYSDLIVSTNEDGQEELVFRNSQIAEKFAFVALDCSKVYISDEDRYSMQVLSEVLKIAVNHNIVSEADLYSTEPVVIERLQSDARTACLWDSFCSLRYILTADQVRNDGSWRKIFAKKRCIDPFVLGSGRVSILSSVFAKNLLAFQTSSQDYWVCGKTDGSDERCFHSVSELQEE